MRATKKSWKNILYACILLAAIYLLFQWYATANSQRIENQNLNYAMDSARQTAQRIESEFGNALLRMRTMPICWVPTRHRHKLQQSC